MAAKWLLAKLAVQAAAPSVTASVMPNVKRSMSDALQPMSDISKTMSDTPASAATMSDTVSDAEAGNAARCKRARLKKATEVFKAAEAKRKREARAKARLAS